MDFEKMASEAPTKALETKAEARRKAAKYAAESQRWRREQLKEKECIARFDATKERFLNLFVALGVDDERDTRPRQRQGFRSRPGDYYFASTASTPDIIMAAVNDEDWKGTIVAKVTASLKPARGIGGKFQGWRESDEFTIEVKGVPEGKHEALTYEPEKFSRWLLAEYNHGNPMRGGLPNVKVAEAERRLDGKLPAINQSLDQIFAAAADRELNPQLPGSAEQLSA